MARLNAIEYAAMQSPVRRVVQRRWELATFERLLDRAGVDLQGARILDAGCGSGYGLELLQQRFTPARLVGFDLMPEQMERARARAVPGAEVRVGDITKIDEPDGAFDAVFLFGILHHVPAWRAALVELARVLTPGGVLCVEEVHGRAAWAIDTFFFFSHPREAAFGWPAFRQGLDDAGFSILGEQRLAWEAARSFIARVRA
ncbi:MAG: class I SAM-dependent methyltransferase [Deltaproteobacteria bacterium]|nr:class I SAM-dependent methyltransferase [Deltaproteobacteria bacterium]